MAQNSTNSGLGKTFIITVPQGASTTSLTSIKGYTPTTIKLPINLKNTKTITKIAPISLHSQERFVPNILRPVKTLPKGLKAVRLPSITSSSQQITVDGIQTTTVTAPILTKILTESLTSIQSQANFSHPSEVGFECEVETSDRTLTATPPEVSENVTSVKKEILMDERSISQDSSSVKSDKLLLPPPMIALKKEKPAVKKMKVMKNVNIENIDIAQELVLKGNLIKSLASQGVEFKEGMITSINEFFNAAKLMFTEKITSLSAEISRLEKDCLKKTELIKELHSMLGTKDEGKSSDEFEFLTPLKLTIGELGGRFLRQIETSIEMALREEHTKRKKLFTLKKCSSCSPGEENSKRAPVTIGVASMELVEALRVASETERATHAQEMQTLFDTLVPHINMNNYAIEEGMLDRLQGGPEVGVEGRELIKDVNMGYPMQVPNIVNIDSLGGDKDLSVAPPTGLRGQSCVVPEFYHYVRNCDTIVNHLGDRPIHRDVAANNIREVKKQTIILKLLSMPLDIYNDEDYTPLHLAIINDASVEIISTLLRHGADFRARDGDGNNVLHLGVEADTLGKLFHPSVRHLVDAKHYHQVVDVHNNEGFTPLQLAAMRGNKVHVQDLLICDPNIDLCDTKSGRTALYHAIENNHLAASILLKDYKADPYIRNYAGTSIIDALCELDSDFSSEMKKLFYNDRTEQMKANASFHEETRLACALEKTHRRKRKQQLEAKEAKDKKRKP